MKTLSLTQQELELLYEALVAFDHLYPDDVSTMASLVYKIEELENK